MNTISSAVAKENFEETIEISSESMKLHTFSTKDWSGYDYEKGENENNFKLKLPSKWVLEGSVISDESGKKIGEFSPPGAIKLKAGQACFDTHSDNDMEYMKTRKRIPIAFDGNNGMILLQESYYSDGGGKHGTWYPQRFCISNSHYAFVITFYSKAASEEPDKKFKSIIESFRFD